MELKIEYLSPTDLTPYANNTRKHNPTDIEQIKRSIELDGFNDPIGIWGDKNLIVEGHGRQIAAIEMGLEKVPCIRLDHMTEIQRKDYAIRHNRTAELSEWDFSQLEQEVAELEIQGIDMSGLKFDTSELEPLPTDLDDLDDAKERVIVSLNFASVEAYEGAKNQLQLIADTNDASLSVKMA